MSPQSRTTLQIRRSLRIKKLIATKPIIPLSNLLFFLFELSLSNLLPDKDTTQNQNQQIISNKSLGVLSTLVNKDTS
ncbi:MAG: hypothetical protein NTV01_03090 [Bacteroidia bacterium]|nr:hypothetical protein [Bacteroidia bacterium]